ncbi:T-complex protein 1 subunit beta [Tanacetum coccineum]
MAAERLFKDEATEEKGERARMDKVLQSTGHSVTVTNDRYRMAPECARSALLERVKDNKEDAEKFRSDLMKIAMTTLSSKILSQDKEHFATLAVDAVMRLKGSTNLESIQIIKKGGGSLKDSFLDEGFILDKKIGLGQPIFDTEDEESFQKALAYIAKILIEPNRREVLAEEFKKIGERMLLSRSRRGTNEKSKL